MRSWILTGVLLGVTTGASAQDGNGLFDSVVRSSIDRGRVFLLESLEEKSNRLHWSTAYPMGFRALVAYALMEAGTEPDHPTLARLFKDLHRMPLTRVYSVSLYVMALDSLWRRQRMKRLKPNRRLTDERMDGKLRRELKKSIAWLINARWPGRGTWGYGHWKDERARNWDDFSNTQFAVLALQVALRHEVAVPDKVFSEVVAAFENNAWTTGEAVDLTCEGPGWWDEPLTGSRGEPGLTGVAGPVTVTRSGLQLKAAPQAWGYRPGFGGPGVPGQYSMIAAGTSSLMVCRRGLDRQLGANRRWDIDRLIAGGVISLSRRFRRLFPSHGDSVHRNYYYTLYSFEKAMDLGGISRLDGVDWYQDQAVVLTNDQRTDGAWGSAAEGLEYAQISTSFALLFLKRATRHLRVEESGPIVTGPGAGEEEQSLGVRLGKVHVPSLGGTVDLHQVFRFLAEDRTREYLDLGREIFATVPPDEVVELLPYLALVRRGNRDAVDRFAEKAIRELSGLPGGSPEPRILEWLASYRLVSAMGTAAVSAAGPEVVSGLAARLADLTESLPMKLTIVDALTRIGSLDAVKPLVAALSDGPFLRERAHRALTTLTARRFPYPGNESEEAVAELVADWQQYWARSGVALRMRVAWDTLRLALERAAEPTERARLADAIVALGPDVVGHIDLILNGERFAFEWVRIRERITGETKGIFR